MMEIHGYKHGDDTFRHVRAGADNPGPISVASRVGQRVPSLGGAIHLERSCPQGTRYRQTPGDEIFGGGLFEFACDNGQRSTKSARPANDSESRGSKGKRVEPARMNCPGRLSMSTTPSYGKDERVPGSLDFIDEQRPLRFTDPPLSRRAANRVFASSSELHDPPKDSWSILGIGGFATRQVVNRPNRDDYRVRRAQNPSNVVT